MQGTRDSQVRRENHAYIIFEAWRCSEDTKEPGDPDCASDEDIVKWIDTKMLAMKVINKKIDFLDFGDTAVRQNEVFVPIVPMKAGQFSDTGNRFRYN